MSICRIGAMTCKVHRQARVIIGGRWKSRETIVCFANSEALRCSGISAGVCWSSCGHTRLYSSLPIQSRPSTSISVCTGPIAARRHIIALSCHQTFSSPREARANFSPGQHLVPASADAVCSGTAASQFDRSTVTKIRRRSCSFARPDLTGISIL